MKYTQFPDGKQASKISGGTRGGGNITFILFMSFIQVILHDQEPLDEVHASHTPSQASDAELSHHGLIKCLYELLKEYTKTIEFSHYLAKDNKKDFHLYHIFHYLV